MFYVLSKLLDSFASPIGLGLLLFVLFFYFRKRKHAIYLLFICFLTIYLFSLPIVSNALWRGLEASAVRRSPPSPPYDVVVILGGMIDDAASASRAHPEYNENIDRLIRGADLLRRNDAHDALLSGDGEHPGRGPAEATQLADQLVDWGIAKERLYTETQSRNTHENALYGAAIIRQHGWQRVLLVTSAFHMQRALGCFAKQGIFPDAAPADFRGAHLALGGAFFLPRGSALADSSGAWREFVGRIVYRIMGYSIAV